MIRSYLLTAFRNLKKNKVFSLINIVGLAIGLSAFVLILLYLQFEAGYDRFHSDNDLLYRVAVKGYQEGKFAGDSYVYTPPIGEDMKQEFAEVTDFVRMSTLRPAYLIYKEFSPLLPFEYFFLDDAFDRLYKSEERFQRIFLYFSVLAIGIALMGLFSLSAYTAQQKSKEIGIRKVLGATVPNILSLFSKKIIILVVIANIIAWPTAYFIIQKWLQNFAYRNEVSIWVFVTVFLGSMAAALATISFQSTKAALKNPADELRME